MSDLFLSLFLCVIAALWFANGWRCLFDIRADICSGRWRRWVSALGVFVMLMCFGFAGLSVWKAFSLLGKWFNQ